MDRHHQFGPENDGKLLRLIEQAGIGRLKKYLRGEMLFWQDDPVDYVYIVRVGAIKVFSVSAEGKTYAQVKELGFLDVQQRLKQRLIELAQAHGIATANGIRIDLDITHEEIGELVAANHIPAAPPGLGKRQRRLWSSPPLRLVAVERQFQVYNRVVQSQGYFAQGIRLLVPDQQA
jgi:CRP-like cAMP-binding protein